MNSIKDAPFYTSHKTVQALKIATVCTRADGAMTLCFAGPYEPLLVDASVVHRYFPLEGDYLVIYADGYLSISPGKVFEEGYTIHE